MRGVSYQAYQNAVANRRLARQEGGQEGEPEGMEPEQIQGGSNKIRIGIILAVIILVVAVTATIYLQPTTATGLSMSLTSGTVIEANSSDVVLAIILSIHNTTNKNMTYYGSTWDLTDNGQDVDSGVFHENYALSPGATRVLNETVDINLGDVVQTAPITTAGTWRFHGAATVMVSGANTTQGFDFNFATQ